MQQKWYLLQVASCPDSVRTSMSTGEVAHSQWTASAFEWNSITMEAHRFRGAGRKRKTGTISCQAPGCAVDLSDAKPYFRRHCICATHMKSPYLLINGEKKRYCQQCGYFESLGFFIGSNRSCKMSLDRRSTIARAIKNRSNSGPPASSRDQLGYRNFSNSERTGSEKCNGSNGKSSAWDSPTEVVNSEAGKLTKGGDQSCPRDIDMALDSRGMQDPASVVIPVPSGRLSAPSNTSSNSNGLHDSHVHNLHTPSGGTSCTVLSSQRNDPLGRPFSSDPSTHGNLQLLSGGASSGLAVLNLEDSKFWPDVEIRDTGRRVEGLGSIHGGGGTSQLPRIAPLQQLPFLQGPCPHHYHGSASEFCPPPPPAPPPAPAPAAAMGVDGTLMFLGMEQLGSDSGYPQEHQLLQKKNQLLQRSVQWEGLPTSPQELSLVHGATGVGKVGDREYSSEEGGGGGRCMSRLDDHAMLSERQSERLLAGFGAPVQLFSAAPSGVVASLDARSLSENPSLEMQLRDILQSAQLESRGWFGAAGDVVMQQRQQMQKHQQQQMHHPESMLRSSSSSASVRDNFRKNGVDGCVPISLNTAGISNSYPAAHIPHGAACSIDANARIQQPYGPWVGEYGTSLGGGGLAGSSNSSCLDTCLGFLHGVPQAVPPSPYGYSNNSARDRGGFGASMGTSMGGGGGVNRMLGLGEGATREVINYRPGEPDRLVRMSLKLTNRAPDELEPATLASLRKMLSVYDKLQSVQGYIRPGCTQVILDAYVLHEGGANVIAEAQMGAGTGSCAETGLNASRTAPGGRGDTCGSSLAFPDAGDGVSCGGNVDAERLLRNPLIRAALRDVAIDNDTSLMCQLEDLALSVGADGTAGEARKLTGLPTIVAASCVAVSTDTLVTEVTLYGTNLHRVGVTYWGRMHGVCHQLQWRSARGSAVVVRLPLMMQVGLMQLEGAAPGGLAVGPSYPLLVLPSRATVEEVHAVAVMMGPASLRRFGADFGLVLDLGVLLNQPLNGVVPVHGSSSVASQPSPPRAVPYSVSPISATSVTSVTSTDRTQSGTVTWGSSDSVGATGPAGGVSGVAADEALSIRAAAVTFMSAATAAAAAAAAEATARLSAAQVGGGFQDPIGFRGDSNLYGSPRANRAGFEGVVGGAARVLEPPDLMTNADDEQVLELLLCAGAVRSLLETSLALLHTFVDRHMLHCNSLIVSRLILLMERFPDRVHRGLAPTPPPAGAAFCLMHCAARAGNLEVLKPVMELERLMGQHCSLLAKGVNGVTPLHIMALLPQAPWLLRSLQRMHPEMERGFLDLPADDGVTPRQLYQMLHGTGCAAADHVRHPVLSSTGCSGGERAIVPATSVPSTSSNSTLVVVNAGVCATAVAPGGEGSLGLSALGVSDMVLAAAAAAALSPPSESWMAQGEVAAGVSFGLEQLEQLELGLMGEDPVGWPSQLKELVDNRTLRLDKQQQQILSLQNHSRHSRQPFSFPSAPPNYSSTVLVGCAGAGSLNSGRSGTQLADGLATASALTTGATSRSQHQQAAEHLSAMPLSTGVVGPTARATRYHPPPLPLVGAEMMGTLESLDALNLTGDIRGAAGSLPFTPRRLLGPPTVESALQHSENWVAQGRATIGPRSGAELQASGVECLVAARGFHPVGMRVGAMTECERSAALEVLSSLEMMNAEGGSMCGGEESICAPDSSVRDSSSLGASSVGTGTSGSVRSVAAALAAALLTAGRCTPATAESFWPYLQGNNQRQPVDAAAAGTAGAAAVEAASDPRPDNDSRDGGEMDSSATGSRAPHAACSAAAVADGSCALAADERVSWEGEVQRRAELLEPEHVGRAIGPDLSHLLLGPLAVMLVSVAVATVEGVLGLDLLPDWQRLFEQGKSRFKLQPLVGVVCMVAPLLLLLLMMRRRGLGGLPLRVRVCTGISMGKLKR